MNDEEDTSLRYKAVIFDFDYTLGDATEAIYAGFCRGFTGMGLPAPEREAVRRTVGLPVQDAYTLLTGDADPERRERFYQLFHPVARDMQARGIAELCPGARELLEALRAAGAALAVVSTKNTESLEHVLAAKGVRDCFTYVVGGDQVARHKPDPEGVVWVLRQLDLSPEEALYCGDTLIDAQTAQAAGTDFCAVLNGTTPAEAFAGARAVLVAPGLPELQAWLGL